jgi:hypothetical protein
LPLYCVRLSILYMGANGGTRVGVLYVRMYTYSLLKAKRRVGYNSPTRQPKQHQPKNNNVDDGDGGDR